MSYRLCRNREFGQFEFFAFWWAMYSSLEKQHIKELFIIIIRANFIRFGGSI